MADYVNFQELYFQINFLPSFLSSSGIHIRIFFIFDGVTEFSQSILVLRIFSLFLRLVNFHYSVFQVFNSFFCLLQPGIYSTTCIFNLIYCDLHFWLVVLYLFAKVLTDILTYICFMEVSFCGFVLFFHLGHIPSHFVYFWVYVLGKSFALESNALKYKRSCNALQCNVSCSPEPGSSGVSVMCVVSALLLWLRHVFLHSSRLQWLSLPVWAGFGPCVVSGLVWGHLGLELSQSSLLPELWQHQTQGCFPCVVT